MGDIADLCSEIPPVHGNHMLKVVLLICAVMVPRGECTVHTALSVLQGPPAESTAGCGMQAQAYLAGTSIGRNIRPDEYAKIVCAHTAIGKRTVG